MKLYIDFVQKRWFGQLKVELVGGVEAPKRGALVTIRARQPQAQILDQRSLGSGWIDRGLGC